MAQSPFCCMPSSWASCFMETTVATRLTGACCFCVVCSMAWLMPGLACCGRSGLLLLVQLYTSVVLSCCELTAVALGAGTCRQLLHSETASRALQEVVWRTTQAGGSAPSRGKVQDLCVQCSGGEVCCAAGSPRHGQTCLICGARQRAHVDGFRFKGCHCVHTHTHTSSHTQCSDRHGRSWCEGARALLD